MSAKWNVPIPDDPGMLNMVAQNKDIHNATVVQSNLRGWMTYAATALPNSRTTQLFINYANNSYLDASGFAPFAQVTDGMNIVDQIYSGYGETPKQVSFHCKW